MVIACSRVEKLKIQKILEFLRSIKFCKDFCMKMVQWNLLLFPSPKNCSNCVVT